MSPRFGDPFASQAQAERRLAIVEGVGARTQAEALAAALVTRQTGEDRQRRLFLTIAAFRTQGRLGQLSSIS